ncbi:MAG: hypothetical protein ACK40O_05585 [Allosphingosinicella sp.]
MRRGIAGGFAGALALAALTLAGCGEGEQKAPERQVTKMKAANPGSDQLKALSEPMRNLGLYRAIRDSGQRCKRVDAAVYQQEYRNMAMWTARCSDTGGFAVFIAPNGDIQVRQCGQAQQLGLPECRVPDAPPAQG